MLILWCQGRGLSQRLGMLKPGGLGTYIGDVNIGGGGAGSETDMVIWGMFILWGGWRSFGTNIGYVNIVGGRGLGQSLGMLIFGGSVWGVWDRYRLILWGQGKGRGRVGGQTLGMLILGGGVWDRKGYVHIMGVGCFGTDIGDVNILGPRG